MEEMLPSINAQIHAYLWPQHDVSCNIVAFFVESVGQDRAITEAIKVRCRYTLPFDTFFMTTSTMHCDLRNVQGILLDIASNY